MMSNSEITSATLVLMLPMPFRLKSTHYYAFKFWKIETLFSCFGLLWKVIDNIKQLNVLGELPNSIFTDDNVGVGADSDSPNIVQKMVSNQVVWHKTCRNSTDTQKVQRARKRGGPEVANCPLKTWGLSSESSTSLYKPVATTLCFYTEWGNKQELRKAAALRLDRESKTVLIC